MWKWGLRSDVAEFRDSQNYGRHLAYQLIHQLVCPHPTSECLLSSLLLIPASWYCAPWAWAVMDQVVGSLPPLRKIRIEFLACGLCPGPALDVRGIWGANQHMGACSLSNNNCKNRVKSRRECGMDYQSCQEPFLFALSQSPCLFFPFIEYWKQNQKSRRPPLYPLLKVFCLIFKRPWTLRPQAESQSLWFSILLS